MGAPQAPLSSLAGRLTERGHDVVVLTAMPNYPRGHVYPGYGGIFGKEGSDGVTIIRSYIYAATGLGIRRLANYFSFVFSSLVVGGVSLPRLDYLITESPPLFLGISGYVLSRLKRARWMFNVSDLWLESAVQLAALSEGLILRMARRLETFFYQKASCVIELIEDATGKTGHLVFSTTPPRGRARHLGIDREGPAPLRLGAAGGPGRGCPPTRGLVPGEPGVAAADTGGVVERQPITAIMATLAYGSASGLASARVAAQTGGRHLPKFPAAFGAMHLGYGAGFLLGNGAILTRGLLKATSQARAAE
jgi:Glycosyl transferase 4-like domain